MNFRYIINIWAYPDSISMENAISGAPSHRKLVYAEEPELQKRKNFYLFRTPEEFYDTVEDPACLNNLINDPKFKDEIKLHKELLLKEMQRSYDPATEAFRKNTKEAYMDYLTERTEYGIILRKDQKYLKSKRN